MTHAESRLRAALIVKAIENGSTVAAEARKHNLSLQAVRNYCQIAGLDIRNGWEKWPDSFAILKRLLDGEGESEIAKEFGISRQRVHQVKQAAIAAGFTQLAKPETDQNLTIFSPE